MELLKQSQATDITFQDKLINSRAQIISNFKPTKEKGTKLDSFGFVIYKPEYYAYFMVITLHAICDKNITDITIKLNGINNHTLKPQSFYKSIELDIAIIKIKWIQLDFNYLLTTEDIFMNLNSIKNTLPFIFNTKTKIYQSFFCYNEPLRIDDTTPSIFFKNYKYYDEKKNSVLINLAKGLSGLLSYTIDNKIDGVLLGTVGNCFHLLPTIYINYMIDKITSDGGSKYIKSAYLSITATIKHQQVFVIESKYHDIEKEDILLQIDGHNITKKAKIKMFDTEIFLDQYIMLCSDVKKYCVFTIQRGKQIIEQKMYFEKETLEQKMNNVNLKS